MNKDGDFMSYTKYVYLRINWLNKSESLTTPLGKTNLNRMDSAIYNIAENLDIAYNELDAAKFDESNADKVIVGMPIWDSKTGILTFQFYDGTEFSVDFNIEKIPVSFSMDSAGVITMTTADGTQWTADISSIIPDYTFEGSGRIAFSKTKNEDGSYTVVADIKKNSITGEYLEPDYLADITTQASSAAASAQFSSDYADNAAFDAKLAQSYAIGGSGIRDGEDTDNAKKYAEDARNSAERAESVSAVGIATTEIVGIVKPDGSTITIDEDGTLHGSDIIEVDSELSETSSNPVENQAITSEINELKNSVSDGKTAVANAVTAKGITTATDATFETIAANVGKITTLSEGTADATATAAQILSGKTAYVKGVKVTGTIASQAAQTITPGTSNKTIAAGKYLSGIQTIKGDSNLIAANIISGKSIFGVAGTAVKGGYSGLISVTPKSIATDTFGSYAVSWSSSSDTGLQSKYLDLNIGTISASSVNILFTRQLTGNTYPTNLATTNSSNYYTPIKSVIDNSSTYWCADFYYNVTSAFKYYRRYGNIALGAQLIVNDDGTSSVKLQASVTSKDTSYADSLTIYCYPIYILLP